MAEEEQAPQVETVEEVTIEQVEPQEGDHEEQPEKK